jgi:hypothetical protein
MILAGFFYFSSKFFIGATWFQIAAGMIVGFMQRTIQTDNDLIASAWRERF